MTDTGTRWKRFVELPEFGGTVKYWAVKYNDETRYVRVPLYDFAELRDWMKPLYAISVTARSI